jgi:isopenicillin-N N-acyltransferase-like protein
MSRTGSPRTHPRIRVAGSPLERGRQYGEAARDRILISRAAYEKAFQRAAGWSWEQASAAAAVFEPEIRASYPQYLEEMAGIAEGAGLSFSDVLTLNTRTEVIWAATARQASEERHRLARECTSFALLGRRTRSGRPLVGQNWDWLMHCFDTLVILEVEQPDAPNYVTVVEAGLLAKCSLNSAGLAVTTNALVTSGDRGEPGIPYHVMLRALADCELLSSAIETVQKNFRASAANYLFATGDDIAVDLEAGPGDFFAVQAILPEDGAIVHTNHFLRSPRGQDDVSLYAMPDSLVRLQRAASTIAGAAEPHDVASLRRALSDHADFPSGVCCHPRPEDEEQWATVMSVIMDPQDRRMWLASGHPCEADFVEQDFGDLLAREADLAKFRPAS